MRNSWELKFGNFFSKSIVFSENNVTGKEVILTLFLFISKRFPKYGAYDPLLVTTNFRLINVLQENNTQIVMIAVE